MYNMNSTTMEKMAEQNSQIKRYSPIVPKVQTGLLLIVPFFIKGKSKRFKGQKRSLIVQNIPVAKRAGL